MSGLLGVGRMSCAKPSGAWRGESAAADGLQPQSSNSQCKIEYAS